MATDALSDVLKAVRLTGAAFFDVIACAPWVAEQPTREMVLPKVLPGAGHLISYHVATEGGCYAAMLGQEAMWLEEGEVIVFTKGDPHVMSSAPGMRAQPVTQAELDAATSGALPFPNDCPSALIDRASAFACPTRCGETHETPVLRE